ncbi:MAG: Stp1/IreP family PP2C-type Ser/Thr phosphatase [Ignavibacteriae bacterium]|nr:MAG: Stp1/IreP family PP2C-type Ser/Thr phosphatase [Ignavibacteriota bacterium]
MSFNFEIGNHSDVGRVRKVNEDYFGTFRGSFGELLIVCDGMGGHKGGETASRLAVEAIKNHFEKLNTDYDVKHELHNALTAANNKIVEAAHQDQSLEGMGSTAVIVLLKDDLAYTANLGDSRIYLVRDETIKQLTTDHSLVQQMIDSDVLTLEEAESHPKKNVITKSLGREGAVAPDISEPIELLKNDKFILCTDGLTNYVKDEEILNVAANNPVQQAAGKLVDIANENGGSDNITVQIAEVKVDIDTLVKSVKKKHLLLYFLIGVVLGIAAIGIFKPDIFSRKIIEPVELDSTKTNLQDSTSADSTANLINGD